ncbi:MAG: CpsD/CapB family tyrosine-protein kinase [Methylococcaceae bacterium]
MDRIQKALEKAKKQRQENIRQEEKLPDVEDNKNIRVVEDINYEQTQTISVSDESLRKNRVVSALKEDGRADLFKILRTKILQRMRANKSNVLAITSPTKGIGKSMVASNLAISIAMDVNYSVLLADLDLRRPRVHEYFDVKPEFGVRDYLESDKAIADLLIHPGLESLVILPAGKPIRRSSELLSTPKMLALASELKNRYPDRIVIIDLPPLLHTDDAMVVMPTVDACVLVVAEGETTEEDIVQSLRLIDETKLMGTILNKSADVQQSGYYYY